LKKLKVLPDPLGMFVKNTMKFVEKLKDAPLGQDDILVSFEIPALNPNVLIPAALKLLER
jgi:hypothetical protein